MATVGTIRNQLEHSTTYIQTQTTLMPPDALATSVNALANTLVAQINTISNLDVQGAAALNTSIQNTMFSQDVKARLATAVSNRAMANAGALQVRGRRPTQLMEHPFNFFTTDDWNVFCSDATTMQKVNVCAERARVLGLNNPTEKTIASLTALLAAATCNPDAISPQDLYTMFRDLKNAFDNQRNNNVQLPHLQVYPQRAAALPQALYTNAYGAGGEPIEKFLENYVAMLRRVPLRSSHRELRVQTAAAAPPAMDAQNMLQALMQLMQNGGFQPAFAPRSRDRGYGRSHSLQMQVYNRYSYIYIYIYI